MLRYLRHLLSRLKLGVPTFNHLKAQEFESKFAKKIIRNHFSEIYRQWEKARESGALWQGDDDQWFAGDKELWITFVNHIKSRTSLEIGSGPFGYLAPCYWIEKRIIIDPLIDFYRLQQTKYFNKTFFTDDIKTYNQPAEKLIEDFRGAVDGFIVCRNALDHCEDPLLVLHNISEYAAPGCYLLFWTDLWHLKGLDQGHRNITRSEKAFDKFLHGLGFRIIKGGRRIRNPEDFIEYGKILQKN